MYVAATNVNNELRKSTKNWDEDTRRKKFEKVQDLSLVSRSSGDDLYSLKNVILQHDLWNHIQNKIAEEVKDTKNKKQWDPIVDLLRKLREGVYASQWSHGDYEFAIKVFELSADCCVKAERYEELSKSLIGLLDHLYCNTQTKISSVSRSYYTVLDILYHCCYLQNYKFAARYIDFLDLSTHEGHFGRQFLRVISDQNSIQYFRLYHYNPYWTFKVLMNNYNDVMRQHALQMLHRAYLSTSIAWIGQWIGIYHDNSIVLSEIDRLVKPSCIDSVDYEQQLVHFVRKKKKPTITPQQQ
ncbi:MAG: hypothetical protein EXX96DRAFT_542473 [Benjaminiella poitrasii]|nr:MAG: hypothetical protein EXX96DRAFT_542473 [Benjaminiella poitrasii]